MTIEEDDVKVNGKLTQLDVLIMYELQAEIGKYSIGALEDCNNQSKRLLPLRFLLLTRYTYLKRVS